VKKREINRPGIGSQLSAEADVTATEAKKKVVELLKAREDLEHPSLGPLCVRWQNGNINVPDYHDQAGTSGNFVRLWLIFKYGE